MNGIIAFIVGCLITALFNVLYWHIPTFGCLEVDETDPEDVKMKLVLEDGLDFNKHKRVVLKINTRN